MRRGNVCSISVAALVGREGESKCLHFHEVLEKNWSNSRLAQRLGVGSPLWEMLDPPLHFTVILNKNILKLGAT